MKPIIRKIVVIIVFILTVAISFIYECHYRYAYEMSFEEVTDE